MEHLKQIAGLFGIKIDDTEFNEKFIAEVVEEAQSSCRDLFTLAAKDPENAPTDKWVYIRAKIGCYFAQLIESAFENPLKFPEEERQETMKAFLTVYELNKKSGALAQGLVHNAILPQCTDKVLDEKKMIRMARAEYEKRQETVPAIADIPFVTQFETEAGQKAFNNTMKYFGQIAAIYYK
jgi:hypothetical protein